jgi:predicted enzyme related to lactoylglutathione lyase
MKLIHHAFRLHVDRTRLEATVAFYEQLQGITCERRIPMAELGIEVAVVGAFIVLGGSEAALEPFRSARALLVVDELDEALEWAVAQGAELLHGAQDAPGGRNATVRHSDGLVAEYYQPTAA